jgi:hypothetical protein
MTRRWMLMLALCASMPLCAQDDAAWKKLDFLIGKWIGVAGPKETPLGAGQGAFSFQPELNRKIIVRRNEARYESGASHDDLMVIYLEGGPRAIYFDSEGHTIHYLVSFPAAESVVFESEAGQGPLYRLSYWMEKGVLQGKFEVGGKTYLTWGARKEAVK